MSVGGNGRAGHGEARRREQERWPRRTAKNQNEIEIVEGDKERRKISERTRAGDCDGMDEKEGMC